MGVCDAHRHIGEVAWPFRKNRCSFLAWTATIAEVVLGIKPPLDYSVFSASSVAVLLALCQTRKSGADS
jgi:hypothetical protein